MVEIGVPAEEKKLKKKKVTSTSQGVEKHTQVLKNKSEMSADKKHSHVPFEEYSYVLKKNVTTEDSVDKHKEVNQQTLFISPTVNTN
jgi:hypothetical protein